MFLSIGGEGEANPIWAVEGQWITNYAAKYNALCFMVEHRFYGKSHPTADLSTDNLSFLNSEQALADLATFSVAMREQRGLTNNTWIAFGGSYPGNLAAWYRLKYPHLVSGSVASSAPVLAYLDFYGFNEVVTQSLETLYSPACVSAFSAATVVIGQMLQTTAGRSSLYEWFGLCDYIDDIPTDISNLYLVISSNVGGVVQYNKDNRAFEGAAGTNITVQTVCDVMTDGTLGPPVVRYGHLTVLLNKAFGANCTDFKYKKMIADLQQTSWNSSASEGGRQWTYQTCTEFGYFQSSDSKGQPFGKAFPIDFFIQQCVDIFGPVFNRTEIEEGIKQTNTIYGALGIEASNIVFVNGRVDPWHYLSVTTQVKSDIPVILINGTAHCANMYPSRAEDLPQLTQARAKISDLIGTWIKS